MRRRLHAGLALAAIVCAACDSGSSTSTATSETAAPTTTLDTSQRIAELEAFEPDPRFAGLQCHYLSASNGSVELTAATSRLAQAFQQQTPIPAADLHLGVRFGSGFPGYDCSDVGEGTKPVVDEYWPATAGSATFTVEPSINCSAATLVLTDVVAHAPDGQDVALGDVTITNPYWQWWHPGECHLFGGGPGAGSTTTTVVTEHEVAALVQVQIEPEVLATLPVGSGPGQLGLENCSECDPGRPWSPVVDSTGRIIIPDTVNRRWVIIDGATTTEVPYPNGASVVGVAMGPSDIVYTLEVSSESEFSVQAYDSAAMDVSLKFEPTPPEMFGNLSFSGNYVSVRLSGTQHFPLVRGYSKAPGVTPDFIADPPTLMVAFDDGRREHWQLPANLYPVLPVAVDNGSVVVRGSGGPGEFIVVELTEDGRFGAGLLEGGNDAFNDSVSIDTRGIVVLQLDSASQTWTILRFPLPVTGVSQG